MTSKFHRRRPSFIDDISGAAIGIDFAHHELHEGDLFLCDTADDVAGLDNGDDLSLSWKMPAGVKEGHIICEYSTLKGGKLELWEASTWTANQGDSEAPIINRRRRVPVKTSIVLENTGQAGFVASDTMIIDATGLSVGSATRLGRSYAWGRQGQGNVGGSRANDEIMLAADTTYSLIFTSMFDANSAHIIAGWYEHTETET